MTFFLRKHIAKLVAGFITLTMFGCSAQNYFDSGNYELAIEKAIKQLNRNPSNIESIDMINSAFNKANENDLSTITKELNGNNEINWTSIYYKYKAIVERQKKIGMVDNLDYSIEFTDYESLMKEAQSKAAETYYLSAQDQIDKNETKKDHQKAYAILTQANKIYPGYKNVSTKMAVERAAGMFRVLVVIDNPKKLALTEQAKSQMLDNNFSTLNSTWVMYFNSYLAGEYYDYTALFELTHFLVESDKEIKQNYADSKEIIEKYVERKDAKGNLIKNEKGEVIKDPVKKTIKAKVRKTTRSKESEIRGKLILIDNFEMNNFKEVPISEKYQFKSESASFVSGKKGALTSESKSLIKQKIKTFPTYQQMILDNAGLISDAIKYTIRKNQSSFGNK
tara:strand:- start:11088 stop:12269 length:1182 start_codon:yes stop_codon:yes gene_type:complete